MTSPACRGLRSRRLGNHRDDGTDTAGPRLTGPQARARRRVPGRAAQGGRHRDAHGLPRPPRAEPGAGRPRRGRTRAPPTPPSSRCSSARPTTPAWTSPPRSRPCARRRRRSAVSARRARSGCIRCCSRPPPSSSPPRACPSTPGPGIILAAAGSRDLRAVGAMESLFRTQGVAPDRHAGRTGGARGLPRRRPSAGPDAHPDAVRGRLHLVHRRPDGHRRRDPARPDRHRGRPPRHAGHPRGAGRHERDGRPRRPARRLRPRTHAGRAPARARR